jgi:hypothetical protein
MSHVIKMCAYMLCTQNYSNGTLHFYFEKRRGSLLRLLERMGGRILSWLENHKLVNTNESYQL